MKNIIKISKILLNCLIVLLLCNNNVFAQKPEKMSSDVVEYNGKMFYLHPVEKKQTIKTIAEIYAVSEDEIRNENKDLKGKLRVGQIIRVPAHDIKKNIEENLVEDDEQVVDNEYNATYYEDADCSYATPNPNASYRVALMIPLYLEQVDSVFIEAEPNNKMLASKPFSFLHFYEGFMIAVDSLVSSQGLKLDLKVYDIDQNPAKLDSAMNDAWLQQADLIVGPFHLKSFERMSGFAMRYNIMIVNPITNHSSIIDNNPNVVKIKPSYPSQMQWLENLIHTRYADSKVFVFRKNKFSEDSLAFAKAFNIAAKNANSSVKISNAHILKTIKKHHNKLKMNNEEFSTDYFENEGNRLDIKYLEQHLEDSTIFANKPHSYIYSIDSLKRMKKTASYFRNNLVIVFGDDKVFATEIINKVNMLVENYPVTLIALPEWGKFDRLFNENLMKMHTIYFDDEYIDYQDVETMRFICKFRGKYGTEPKDIAYQGFDVAWYFLNALMRYGSDMKSCLPSCNIPLLETEFRFSRKTPSDGLENHFWNVYQFKNYEKVILPLEINHQEHVSDN